MSEPCSQINLLMEISGDIKTLVTEFKAMNGSLRDTEERFKEHEKESKIYRYHITIVWFVMQALKWAIGGGLLGVSILHFFKK